MAARARLVCGATSERQRLPGLTFVLRLPCPRVDFLPAIWSLRHMWKEGVCTVSPSWRVTLPCVSRPHPYPPVDSTFLLLSASKLSSRTTGAVQPASKPHPCPSSSPGASPLLRTLAWGWPLLSTLKYKHCSCDCETVTTLKGTALSLQIPCFARLRNLQISLVYLPGMLH